MHKKGFVVALLNHVIGNIELICFFMGSFLIFQSPEDEATVTEIIKEAVIESAEKLFLKSENVT